MTKENIENCVTNLSYQDGSHQSCIKCINSINIDSVCKIFTSLNFGTVLMAWHISFLNNYFHGLW